MAGNIFWSGMTRRLASALRLDDKLLIGKADKSDHQYSEIEDIQQFLAMKPLRKDGYRWYKGDGNEDLDEYEAGDEIYGVGTLFPGYHIGGYIKTSPMTDKNQHIVITSSTPI